MFSGYTAPRANKERQWRRMRRREDPVKTASVEHLLGYSGLERARKHISFHSFCHLEKYGLQLKHGMGREKLFSDELHRKTQSNT